MSYRVGGALALIAAVLLAISIASHGWWSGHPVVEGHEHATQDISIGLLGGEGCNTGGDGSCKKILLGGGFKTLSAIELAVGLATLLLALALAATVFLEKTKRARLATLVLVAGAATALLALVLALTGPDMIKAPSGTTVPIGISTFLGIVGGLLAITGGWISSRPPRPATLPITRGPFPVEPWMSPAPAAPPPRAMPTPPAPRPLPEPPPPVAAPPLPSPPPRIDAVSPGGKLPGLSGPLAPQSSAHPPYVASGLRPLYELPGQAMQPVAPAIAMPALPPMRPRQVARPDSETEDSRIEPPPPPPPPIAAQPRTIAGVAAKPLTAPPPFASRPLPPITRPPPLRMPVPQVAAVSANAPTLAAPPLPPIEEPAPSEESEPGDSTDANVQAVSDSTAETQSAPEDSVDIETTAHERVSAEHLETVPLERPSISVMVSTPRPPPSMAAVIAAKLSAATSASASASASASMSLSASATELSMSAASSMTDAQVIAAPEALDEPPPPAPPPPARKSAPAIPAGPISSTAPATLPPPRDLDVAAASHGPSPACPQCDAPMSWVEEHLRFYCKSCKMYF